MIDVLLVLVQMALQIALPWAVVRRDLKRLGPEALSRSWNDASFWCAVVAFGALALPVHFAKSRRSLGGLLLGLLWLVLVTAVAGAVNWLIVELSTTPAATIG